MGKSFCLNDKIGKPGKHFAKWLYEKERSKPATCPRENKEPGIAELIIDLQPVRAEDGIKVLLANAQETDMLGEFHVDSQYFHHALTCVVSNAVKYSYPNTTVTVTVTREENRLFADIRSTGLPIRPQEREDIFLDRYRGILAEMFVRSGTGQGLYLARQIMRGFGGELELLESSWDETLSLPQDSRKWPPAERNTFRLILPKAFK
jgi:signal transduction histidine kinase